MLFQILLESFENAIVTGKIIGLRTRSTSATLVKMSLRTGIGLPSNVSRASDHAAIINESTVAFAMLEIVSLRRPQGGERWLTSLLETQ